MKYFSFSQSFFPLLFGLGEWETVADKLAEKAQGEEMKTLDGSVLCLQTSCYPGSKLEKRDKFYLEMKGKDFWLQHDAMGLDIQINEWETILRYKENWLQCPKS